MTPQTVEAIAEDVYGQLSLEDKQWFATATFRDLDGLHHTLGQQIRNFYGLWVDHPLTEKWRTDPTSHDIRDDVDYSEDHPDQISGKVLEAISLQAHRERVKYY